MVNKSAIVLLTKTPNKDQLDFYSRFSDLDYDVYCCVDDNKCHAYDHKNVHLLKVDERVCKKNGFVNFAPSVPKVGGCTSWDKALYTFSNNLLHYDKVWFFEDDVFIPQPELIKKIEIQNKECDFLCSTIKSRESDGDWHWFFTIPKAMPPPHFYSMMCACMMSSRLLGEIRSFVRQNKNRVRMENLLKSLNTKSKIKRFASNHIFHRHQPAEKCLFIESFIPTLAMAGDFNVAQPEELKSIHFRNETGGDDYKPNSIYHPIKDHSLHDIIRENLRISFP